MRKYLVLVACLALVAGVGAAYARSSDQLPTTLAGHTFDFRVDPFIQPPGTRIVGLRFALRYSPDGKKVTYWKLGGNAQGPSCEIETIHVTKVGRGLYFIRWVEKSGLAVARTDNLVTGKVQLWFVVPTSLTGAPEPVTISPTGTLKLYRGHSLPRCTATGAGT